MLQCGRGRLLGEQHSGGQRVESIRVGLSAKPKKPSVSEVREELTWPVFPTLWDFLTRLPDKDRERSPFEVGDKVHLRPTNGRCDVVWSGPHRVTAITSAVSVELEDDVVSRHISYIRSVGPCEWYRSRRQKLC